MFYDDFSILDIFDFLQLPTSQDRFLKYLRRCLTVLAPEVNLQQQQHCVCFWFLN